MLEGPKDINPHGALIKSGLVQLKFTYPYTRDLKANERHSTVGGSGEVWTIIKDTTFYAYKSEQCKLKDSNIPFRGNFSILT